MESEYFDTREAAAAYGLSVSYLNKLRVSGGGCPYAKVGRRVLYRKADFERWVSAHVRLHTSDDDVAQVGGTAK